ncbi:MAG: radical SAM protein [Chloroflexi bacterium]|nr:radical SAM protein [Chloroflexota bacterium]
MVDPVDAVLAVNYRCNARCTMCHIWEAQTSQQLPPWMFAALPSTLRTINVSGGEPYLREDLPDVVRAIRTGCPGAQITISTNGILTERVESMTRNILRFDPGIALGVSIDGIGEKHDEVRGVRGAFGRAVDTLKRLKALGIDDLRIAFTASAANLTHFFEVYQLARRLDVQFTCAVAHNSSHYFRTEGNSGLDRKVLRSQIEKVAACELKTLSPKRWARAYFASGLCAYMAGRRPLPCEAGGAFFFLSPNGDVYPCNVLEVTMGNLYETPSFGSLWSSQRAEAARKAVARCEAGCWMICTARTAMRKALPRVALWTAGKKIRAHIGCSVVD